MNQNLYNSAMAHSKEGTSVEGGNLGDFRNLFEFVSDEYRLLLGLSDEAIERSPLLIADCLEAADEVFMTGVETLADERIFSRKITDRAKLVFEVLDGDQELIQFHTDLESVISKLGIDQHMIGKHRIRTSKVLFNPQREFVVVLAQGLLTSAAQKPPVYTLATIGKDVSIVHDIITGQSTAPPDLFSGADALNDIVLAESYFAFPLNFPGGYPSSRRV